MTPVPLADSIHHGPYLSKWRYHAVLWSVVLAALGYLGFALWSGWQDVVLALSKVGPPGIVIALTLSSANYGLRFIRWQMYLNAMEHPMPWRPSLKIYLAGFALTTTPGKAGEALRGVLLKPFGMPYAKSFAAFFSERLSDLFAVLLLTLFGLTVYPTAQPWIAAGAAAVVAALLALSSKTLPEKFEHSLRGDTRITSWLHHLLQILLHARRCHTPVKLAAATILSVLAWAAEAWAFHLVLHWIGIDVPLAFAVFVYAIAMLAGALSFLPGGLGGTEAVMFALLLSQGAAHADAIAATIIIRMTTLWFAVGISIVTLAAGNMSAGVTAKPARNQP